MKNSFLICVLCLSAGLITMTGCGGGSVSDHDIPVGEETVSVKDQCKNWLDGIAQSGTLDSGALVMKEEFEKLAAEGVDLTQEFDELMNAKSESAVKSKAKAMLSKLN